MRFQHPYYCDGAEYNRGSGEWPFIMSDGTGRGDNGGLDFGHGVGDGEGNGTSFHVWSEVHLLHGYTMLDAIVCVRQF